MTFARISIAHPRAELHDEVLRHYEDLIASSAKLPGFVAGYVLRSVDESAEVGRVTLWESHAAANHAANDTHIMSLHAELSFDLPESLQEWDLDVALTVTGPEA